VAVAKGRKHDFRVFKESKVRFHKAIHSINDSGYQGIQKIHSNTTLPYKGTKKKPLTKAQKKYNHDSASQRIAVEHVIRSLKIFRLLAERYRNRRRRFGLRVNLIAGIYNYELNN
jgi:hypothetical protein